MAGGGTTGGGAFRYPYQFVDIVDEIKQKLERMGVGHEWERLIDDFIALTTDRDRALEDYATYAAGAIAFVTVDAGGSGDYTTIKEALEAVPAGIVGDFNSPTVIYVKPVSESGGGYDESALGTITIAANTNILLISGFATGDWASAETYHRQFWRPGQITHTGSYSSLTLKGFFISLASSTTVLFTTASDRGGRLHLDDCTINNPLWASTTDDTYTTIYLTGCNGTLHGGLANNTGFPTNIIVRDSKFTLGSLSGAFGCSAMSFGRIVDFQNCELSLAFGNATFTGSFSDANGAGAIFSRVRVDSCVWQMTQSVGTFACTTVQAVFTNNTVSQGSNNGNSPGTFSFTNCGFGTTSFYGGVEYGNSFISNNNMENGTLVYTADPNNPAIYEQSGHPVVITGSWTKITLNANHCMLMCYFPGSVQAPNLTVTGHNNIIIGTFYQYWFGGRGAGSPVLCSGDNNYFIIKTGNWSGSYVDTGSGNVWNGAVNALTMEIAEAKGDLLAAFQNDDIRRLAVGTDGQALEADSTATLGVAWKDTLKTRLNAKGDLFVAAADNDPQPLSVGNDARIPRANSAAYLGVSWEYQRTLNNRLTQNQASLETDTAGWAAEAGCTIARSIAQSSHGAASLEITKS